jgi:hypothetical protein
MTTPYTDNNKCSTGNPLTAVPVVQSSSLATSLPAPHAFFQQALADEPQVDQLCKEGSKHTKSQFLFVWKMCKKSETMSSKWTGRFTLKTTSVACLAIHLFGFEDDSL